MRRADGAPAHWVRVFRDAMACRFEVLLDEQAGPAVAAATRALIEADRIEAAWSVFQPDSQLAAINRRAGSEPVSIDRELHDLLARCRRLHAMTNGAFDITSTPLSRCWRFLDRQPRVPDAHAIEEARARVGLEHLRLSSREPTAQFARAGMELNLGAIGKGYAVGRIAAALRAEHVRHALVSAGGSSVQALGGRAGGWHVALRTGGAARRPAGDVWLRDVSMATTGAAEQGFDLDGIRYGHVIDPRSGWPARGVRSVTVITDDAADADALATACFVDGIALAERLCANHPALLVILLLDGEARPRMIGQHPGAIVEVA